MAIPRNPAPRRVLIYHVSTGTLVPVQRIQRTLEEWKRMLPPLQYHIARLGDTEQPFRGTFYSFNEPGLYQCACCGTDLFSSEAKFDSGTGWPSFSEPVHENNIVIQEDLRFGMVRTEVLCARCGAHLGHVFDDGPPPRGMRYCLNGASLSFVPGKPVGNRS